MDYEEGTPSTTRQPLWRPPAFFTTDYRGIRNNPILWSSYRIFQTQCANAFLIRQLGSMRFLSTTSELDPCNHLFIYISIVKRRHRNNSPHIKTLDYETEGHGKD